MATTHHRCPFVMNLFYFELSVSQRWNWQHDTCFSGAVMWCAFPLFCFHALVVLQGNAAISVWRDGHSYFWCCKRTEEKLLPFVMWIIKTYLNVIYSTPELNFRASKININGSLKIYFPMCYFYRVFLCWNTLVFKNMLSQVLFLQGFLLLKYLCFYSRWYLAVMGIHYILLNRLF